eukprot:2095548-Pleurochrysis_carterae.AAC.1
MESGSGRACYARKAFKIRHFARRLSLQLSMASPLMSTRRRGKREVMPARRLLCSCEIESVLECSDCFELDSALGIQCLSCSWEACRSFMQIYSLGDAHVLPFLLPVSWSSRLLAVSVCLLTSASFLRRVYLPHPTLSTTACEPYHDRTQNFVNGTASRRAEVRAVCSSKNEHALISIEEPDRHHYVLVFSTPLVCELNCAYAIAALRPRTHSAATGGDGGDDGYSGGGAGSDGGGGGDGSHNGGGSSVDGIGGGGTGGTRAAESSVDDVRSDQANVVATGGGESKSLIDSANGESAEVGPVQVRGEKLARADSRQGQGRRALEAAIGW